MDGYAITQTWEEAEACYGMEGVRHVGELDSGRGFVAFDGPIPCEGTILANVTESDFWWYKVRRLTPQDRVRRYTPGGAIETLALYSWAEFDKLPGVYVLMASPIVGDLILAITRGVIGSPMWAATEVSYRDMRVNDGELVTA